MPLNMAPTGAKVKYSGKAKLGPGYDEGQFKPSAPIARFMSVWHIER